MISIHNVERSLIIVKKAWVSFWATVVASLSILNWTCHKKPNWVPFSQVVRWAFNTKTKGGKIALTSVWLTITAVLLPHWFKQVEILIEDIVDNNEMQK